MFPVYFMIVVIYLNPIAPLQYCTDLPSLTSHHLPSKVDGPTWKGCPAMSQKSPHDNEGPIKILAFVAMTGDR